MTPAPRSTDAPAALTAQRIPAQGSPDALDSMERSAWQKRLAETFNLPPVGEAGYRVDAEKGVRG